MTFIVTTPDVPDDEGVISAGGFWPDVNPDVVRDSQRIDMSVTKERLRNALIESLATVAESLATWRATQEAAGHTDLEAVPALQIDGKSINTHRFFRAVGCLAKANVVERYRDFDSTPAGDKKAEKLDESIEDLRRDGFWAIADIQGRPRTQVELI